MNKTIFFDADDTLWDEQIVLQTFERAVEKTLDENLGYPSGFASKFIELENKNIPHIGYGFSSYIFSVAEAIAANPEWYRHKEKLLDSIRDVIRQSALQGPPIIQGVEKTLSELKNAGFRLCVLTRGIEFE